MDKRVCISIIVPVYKIKEEYLRQCIDTLVHQTLEDIEILLIDDGSPDNCGQICDEYAQKDHRVQAIHQKNQGVSVARNAGMDVASGEYVMFVDSDDWLELDCCERVLAAMREQNCEIVLFRRYYENETTTTPDNAGVSRALTDIDLQKIRVDVMIANDCSETEFSMARAPYCRLISSKVLKNAKVHFVPGIKRAQDNIFNLYLFEHLKRVYYLNYIGYHYRRWDNSISYRYNEKMYENVINYLHAIYDFISQYHINEDQDCRALGIGCIIAFTDIERCKLFHKESKLEKKDCIRIMKEFMNDEIVRKYTSLCTPSDFKRFRYKLRFILLRRRWFGLYYSAAKMFYDYRMKKQVRIDT